MSAAPAELSFLERPALFDGPGNPKEAMRQYGLDLHLSFIQFGQGLVAGDGDQRWEYGGKLHGKLTLDGAKLGLWEGFAIGLIGAFNYGDNGNGDNGTLLPVTTALAFPQNGGEGGDLSLTLTQRFGTHVSLSVGKFNMIDAASRTPLLGGGGIDTFWNVGLAAPISGLVPPFVTGASLNVTTQPAQISLMLYDPHNAQQTTGLEDWGADLSDIPELFLPPGSDAALGTNRGSYLCGLQRAAIPLGGPEHARRRLGDFWSGRFQRRQSEPVRLDDARRSRRQRPHPRTQPGSLRRCLLSVFAEQRSN
jgi:hypothetical protein